MDGWALTRIERVSVPSSPPSVFVTVSKALSSCPERCRAIFMARIARRATIDTKRKQYAKNWRQSNFTPRFETRKKSIGVSITIPKKKSG